ncbi:hypothetical protein ACOQFV_09140 [Nocardiopsis changdeensis]|uniref:Uncharacterized protein n=1 Tax=Nocardiopsis changdeensis TaxID=2831969 RepID=A0ABX8BHG9_9ACTN|nr:MULTISPECIES: hypothetical protein [Nocardiopsis]QUX20293.1 hypothetical protein KGD84_17340 [Nocardiopsis changdeensis]QYX36223.1 hypothetical protein K1J57_26795 [Nocardiopsis sp. MT53]
MVPEKDTGEALAIVRTALAEDYPDASMQPAPGGPRGAVRVAPAGRYPADDLPAATRWRVQVSRMATDLEGAGALVEVAPDKTHLIAVPRTGEIATYATSMDAGDNWHLIGAPGYTRCGKRKKASWLLEKLPDDQVCEPCRTGPAILSRPEDRGML